jgi:hypothetical protein
MGTLAARAAGKAGRRTISPDSACSLIWIKLSSSDRDLRPAVAPGRGYVSLNGLFNVSRRQGRRMNELFDRFRASVTPCPTETAARRGSPPPLGVTSQRGAPAGALPRKGQVFGCGRVRRGGAGARLGPDRLLRGQTEVGSRALTLERHFRPKERDQSSVSRGTGT